ncbi:helix-turn-helix transcriptional regulator [Marinobacterium zhoushanense]|uniref:Helix-turn-helix transcriptional regulator n=2 Tax=Marinobacterium zhoushanense TaxID=1679163 RepID=A0ABQ1K3G1_9GAMM|nr:helix-turn-helix transcriptional regulator [Marinobacterium zhoushanense]
MYSAKLNLDVRDMDLFAKIVWTLGRNLPADRVRGDTLTDIGQLLKADYVASYIWDDARSTSTRCLAHNIDTSLLDRYDCQLESIDFITPTMRKQQGAAAVDEVIERRTLETSEFYNTFLAPAGMHHGINIYFFDNHRDVGDLRIWRDKSAPPFGIRELSLLNALKIYFETALTQDAALQDILTRREQEVVSHLRHGLSDKQIARELGVGFTTIRSHLNSAMHKLDCANRTELALKLTHG